MGRFINVDAFASTGQGLLGFNMFAYCCNNPVIFADHTGNAAHLIIQVAVNDGGYAKSYIETDDDPKSANLGASHVSIPNADSTVTSVVKRDGYYKFNPDQSKEVLLAAGGVACFFIPTHIDDAVMAAQWAKYLKWGKNAFSTLSEIVAFRDDIATLLNLPSNEVIYDRYSITQRWTTIEPVSGRSDIYKKVSHCMVSYYYCVNNGSGGYEWNSCGVSYSFTEQIYPVS